MDRQEELIQKLKNEIRTLSFEKRRIIFWLISHIAFLDLIDEGKILSEEELEIWMEKAKREKDDSLSAMVIYKRLKDEKRTEKQKIPLDKGGELAYNSDSQSEDRE